MLQPGWRWSECIKPIAGTDSCQNHHVGAVTSGQLTIRHNDGTEIQVGPGDAYVIDPGHDAWVSGSEPFMAYEFDSQAADNYAKSRSAAFAKVGFARLAPIRKFSNSSPHVLHARCTSRLFCRDTRTKPSPSAGSSVCSAKGVSGLGEGEIGMSVAVDEAKLGESMGQMVPAGPRLSNP